MFSHILTPLDGSPLAACVFPHVVAIARATGAQITLLRVLERSGPGLEGHVNPFDWQMQKREAQAYLNEMAASLQYTLDFPVKTTLLEGSPAAQIVEYAQRTEADVVVLSSHGQGGLSGWHTSSIAHKVSQRAGTSVLLVRAWRPEPRRAPAQWGEQRYHRILVPLDGSPRAECVLPIATALAAQADALWLVHVVTQPDLFQRLPLTTEDQALLAQIVSRNQQQAAQYLAQFQTRLLPAPHTHLLTNHNVDAMLHRFVAEHQINLVLLSAHGCAGQAQWPFGSLTQSFIHYGETPLLIVQDMPLCASGAIQTALQSVVATTRTASVTDRAERPLASQRAGPTPRSDARYPPTVAHHYAYGFLIPRQGLGYARHPTRKVKISGGVSNVDIDENNALLIKAIGAVISTVETLPHRLCASRHTGCAVPVGPDKPHTGGGGRAVRRAVLMGSPHVIQRP